MLAIVVVSLACATALRATTTTHKLFGTIEFGVDNLDAIPRWQSVLRRTKAEKPVFDACFKNQEDCTTPALIAWRAEIIEAQDKPIIEKLAQINKFANQWPYKTDYQIWGKSDFWASPTQFMTHSGDCEDYSIFKLMTLKYLKIPPEDMRIVVVRDTIRDIAHAILAVYTKEDVYILDSLFDTPLPHRDVLQYTPYYSVNETTRWTHLKPLNK